MLTKVARSESTRSYPQVKNTKIKTNWTEDWIHLTWLLWTNGKFGHLYRLESVKEIKTVKEDIILSWAR